MKYLIMIYSNPMSRQAWEGLSDAQRVEMGLGHRALTEALAESGELVVSVAHSSGCPLAANGPSGSPRYCTCCT